MRKVVLILSLVCFMGGNCNTVMLTCGNPLDASELGFGLSVPSGFDCIPLSSLELSFAIARATYQQESTDISIGVLVAESEEDGTTDDDDLEGVTTEDLGTQTTGEGLEFRLQKITLDLEDFGTAISFSAGIILPSGNSLIISVTHETDETGLQDILDSVIESVVLITP